jgi:hypothetical protein
MAEGGTNAHESQKMQNIGSKVCANILDVSNEARKLCLDAVERTLFDVLAGSRWELMQGSGRCCS